MDELSERNRESIKLVIKTLSTILNSKNTINSLNVEQTRQFDRVEGVFVPTGELAIEFRLDYMSKDRDEEQL